jgi:hypothetical protein
MGCVNTRGCGDSPQMEVVDQRSKHTGSRHDIRFKNYYVATPPDGPQEGKYGSVTRLRVHGRWVFGQGIEKPGKTKENR